ncbi:MAG: glycosyltransferase family 39 protein [Solirubrobacteraceae bacterium]
MPAGLVLLVAASAVLRSGMLGIGYWTDEGIAVGIASHPLSEIPGLLRMDGSPPLYYVLLHGWMEAFGTSEAATRALSLGLALAAAPAAFWAGRALYGARGGWLAAGLAAALPYLSVYGQETRMYALMALLSLIATTAFVLAVVRGDRRHLVTLGAALVAALYTHNWALFMCAGIGAAWLVLWRTGRASGRDLVLLMGAVAMLYAPWVPTLVDQARHTGAPWSRTPGIWRLIIMPGAVFGAVGAVLLALLAVRVRRRLVGVLLLVAGITAVAAWGASQLEPGWAVRYFAVLVGPLVLAATGVLLHSARWAVALVAVACVLSPVPAVKSNARSMAAAIGPVDVALVSAPEQVPVLSHYLPAGYVTPTGPVADPLVTDWRDLVDRMRSAPAGAIVARAIAGLAPGERLAVVTTVVHPPADPTAPLLRASRELGRRMLAQVASDPRLRLVAREWPAVSLDVRAQLRASVYVRR